MKHYHEKPNQSPEGAAKALEEAQAEVLAEALSLERDPTEQRVKEFCEIVRDWKRASEDLVRSVRRAAGLGPTFISQPAVGTKVVYPRKEHDTLRGEVSALGEHPDRVVVTWDSSCGINAGHEGHPDWRQLHVVV